MSKASGGDRIPGGDRRNFRNDIVCRELPEGVEKAAVGSSVLFASAFEIVDDIGFAAVSARGPDMDLAIAEIADVFDALSHDRCYKKAWEDADVFAFFEKEKPLSILVS